MNPRDLLLRAGTTEHYDDPQLYDHEYRRRRRDVRYYRELCRAEGKGRPVRILELGCGTGRLLVPLVRDGHEVLGVDRARPMLQRCQDRLGRLPASRKGRAQLLQADFRELPLQGAGPGPFAVVLCPFNAFMHLYERQDVERFLGGVRAQLAPGGLFAFDVLLPDLDWLGRDPERRYARTRFRHPVTGERLVYSNSVAYDPVHQIAFIRLYYEPDAAPAAAPGRPAAPARPTSEVAQGGRVVHLAHRQFFPQELEALLHYNGFRIERIDGGFDGEPLTYASTEQVICARVR